MQTQTLAALAKVGTYPDDDGNVRLYHATSSDAADAIVRDKKLIPAPPTDPAELALLRSRGFGGHIYLASSPAIGNDLSGSQVVVAVDVAVAALPDWPLRDNWGDPPRVELELQAPIDEEENILKLALAYADRLERRVKVEELPLAVQGAIELFQDSPVGRQLSAIRTPSGLCQDASIRFLAALREQGSDGQLLAWGSPESTWWHCTVQPKESDVIVDWTARQFEPNAAYPRIETRTVAEARWNLPGLLDINSAIGRNVGQLPDVPTWEEARGVIGGEATNEDGEPGASE
jgi:hypothetical protein